MQLQIKDEELAALKSVFRVLRYGSDAVATKTLTSLRRGASMKKLASSRALKIRKYAGVHTNGMNSGPDMCTASI